MRVTFAAGSALVSALLLAAPAAAADTKAGDVNVPTVTRLVQLFLNKEASIGTAIRAADSTALGALLTDDFELRENARPATPIPRDAWMRETLATRTAGGEIRGMAVHDFGSVAIASFTQSIASGAVFIVDVWQASGNDWKLAVRYSSSNEDVRSRPRPVPRPGEIPKKY
jgi:hypothetical protein